MNSELLDTIQKAAPCVFCAGTRLAVSAYVFRAWHVHCVSCEAKGPLGHTPDEAIFKWNTTINESKKQRELILEGQMEYQQPKTVQTLWKAIRMQRVFTVNDIERLSDQKRSTVYNYTRLLKQCGFIREEGREQTQGAPITYRCIKPEVIQAPGWTELQAQEHAKTLPGKVRNLERIELNAVCN